METPLNGLSGSALRKLALHELRQFIRLLDNGTTAELQSKKAYLTAIFAELSEKEQEEFHRLIYLGANVDTSNSDTAAALLRKSA